MREYLYMLGTRGTAFWEYYYSFNMFDDDKWDINAEASNWIEDNFDILQKSKMFGGKPDNGDVYGYSCWNGSDGIVSLRNPSNQKKTYTIKYDRQIGVGEGTNDVYGKVIIGDMKYQTDKTLSYGAEIVRQEGSYTLSIDEGGYLNFSLNGVNVNSKYTEKTIKDGAVNSSVKGMIADGEEHQFTAIKEINGMLKLYIDGNLVASEFNEKNANPVIKKNNVVFADGLTGSTAYVTVVDRAMAYDEIEDFVEKYDNVAASKNNSKVKISAYDVTERKAVNEKSDRHFSHLNDGNKNYSANYLELTDTENGKNHSRYVEIDLGAEYELDKLHMTRYADGRTYGATVISLSNDANFNDATIVYNSDEKGTVHNLGKGKDKLYAETTDGKEINLESPVKARYIRIYVSGTEKSTSDHLVEFEAYGKKTAGSSPVYRIDYSKLDAMLNEDLSKTYTVSSIKKYEEAASKTIKAAQKLLEDKNATSDADVEKFVDELNTHRKQLEKRADTTEAQKVLDELNAEKLKEKDYTSDSWKAYISAKGNLEKAVKDTSDISEKQMTELINLTKETRNNLIKVGTVVNVDALEKLYNTYVTMQQGNYTDKSWNRLQEALKNAKTVLDNKNRTEEEVKKAYEALNKAIAGLELKETNILTKPENKPSHNGGNQSPQTGDTFNMGLWLGALILFGGTLSGIGLKKYKKRMK